MIPTFAFAWGERSTAHVPEPLSTGPDAASCQESDWVGCTLHPWQYALSGTVPDRMREPAFPGQAALGDSGENLVVALEALCSDAERKDVLTAWLRELHPHGCKGSQVST